MPLTESERRIIAAAGSSQDPSIRRQAVTIVLSQTGDAASEARGLLAESYLATIQPSFHLIPRGDAMARESEFEFAYHKLEEATSQFTDVSEATLVRCLTEHPYALAPLRMVLGFTVNELAVAMRLTSSELRTTGGWLRSFERNPPSAKPSAKRQKAIEAMARAALDVMDRAILGVPTEAQASFHSKLDKRDTRSGWHAVEEHAREGVPYWALLYQRYVGGVWRQVQDAYSEVKGDALLELPLANLLASEGVPFYQSPPGASGATATAAKFGLSPGPDFLIPAESPTVLIETKVGEDGGTVRDKASRIRNLALSAHQRGFVACAVIDGKGWSERPTALADVIVATEGRTYSLATLSQLLAVPEIARLRRDGPPER